MGFENSKMKIFRAPGRLTRAALADREKGLKIGLVPTLGFLHDGHAALIERARRENGRVVVTRFVNPAQFRARAFRDYPRDEKRDIGVCRGLGVDYFFSPADEDMYGDGFDTAVEVKNLAGRLEGGSIRWHYRGVATVVAKLFNIAQPHRAYFGRKDPHQLTIIRRMAEDLNFPVKIVAVATRRDEDGVALSSRNSLLGPEQRAAARVIPRAVGEIQKRVRLGAIDRAALARELAGMIQSEPLASVDFVAVVDADTLREDVYGEKTLVYAAVYIGGARLTDSAVAPNRKPADG